MRAISFIHLILLGTLASQAAHAVHPIPAVPNNCLYLLATPHRPDPAPLVPYTPEQRCQRADSFALGNVPTTPVGVIVPSGEPRYYCTLDGTTLATPFSVADDNPALARTLAGATPCSGDAICTGLFGAAATCKAFGPDASGRSDNGWTSMGPASSFAIASDMDGDPGAHSIYVRSENGAGHIFYFSIGVNRTHSLTAAGSSYPHGYGDLPILDITFCKAAGFTILQKARPFGCTGFCPQVPCCGAHFPCAGAPDFPPLVPEPEERLAGLDLQVQALVDSGALNQGQANGMQQRITNVLRSLEKGNLNQACNHMSQLIVSIDHNINNGSLNPGAAAPLEAEAIAVRDALGCS